MMKKFLAIHAGLAALLGSGLAHAGFSPYYYGGGFGTSDNNGSDGQFCPNCDGSEYTLHTTHNHSYKLYGGSNLTSNFGVEAELTNLGETYDLDLERTWAGGTELIKAQQKTRGIGVSAKYNHRLTRNTRVYAKAGAFAWQNKNRMHYTNEAGLSETFSTKDEGISPTVGAGIEYEITDHWSVRAGWDHYADTGQGDQFLYLNKDENYADLRSVKTDSNMFYVGATFNF